MRHFREIIGNFLDVLKCIMETMKSTKKIELGQFYTSSQVANFMVSLITKEKHAKVLESGFGSGVFLTSLVDQGFQNIVGYDIDQDNYHAAKKLFKDSVTLVCDDYLNSSIDDKFDVIIGNPPYVSWNRIIANVKEKLLVDLFWKPYINGEWDLLYAFIIWSVEKLNDNGELIYIVPFNWFNATYARSLRQFLIKNGQFEVINHFGEFKLFADCFPNNIIFRYRKTKKAIAKLSKVFISDFYGRKGNIDTILENIQQQYANLDALDQHHDEALTLQYYYINQFNSDDPWYLASPNHQLFVDKIEKKTKNVKIGDHFNVAVGLVSGFDKAFWLTQALKNKLNDKEKKLIKNFTKAANCKPFITSGSEQYIFTESIDTEASFIDYPNIKAHLETYKENLEKRYMSKSKPWWKWATIRNLDIHIKFETESKIFVPCIDRSKISRFALTNESSWGAGDVISISSKTGSLDLTLFCLAWLNSTYVNQWYRIKGSKSGHRIKYTQAYVTNIPFLLPNDDEKELKLYKQIIENTLRIVNKDINADTLIKMNNELFGQFINEK